MSRAITSRVAFQWLIRQAREFPSQEAWEAHKKEFPGAERSNHTVKGEGDSGSAEDDEGGSGKKKMPKLHVPEEDVREFMGELPDYHLEIIAGEDGEITESDLRRARAVKAQLKRGIADAADICEMSPPVCEGNLEVYRESMPQLSADEPLSQMLWTDAKRIKDNDGGDGFASPSKGWEKVPWDELTEKEQGKLKKEWAAGRRKGKAAVDAGADPDDERTVFQQLLDAVEESGVEIGSQKPPHERVEVGQLKATQREIKAGKTFGMADNYFSGKYDPSKSPIIISSDNHILDGHHRYAAMLTVDPEAKMNVIRVDLPMRDFLERSFEQPGVFRADLQDNIVSENDPLDLARDKGAVWKQRNGKWYGKNQEGKAGGPYATEKAARKYAKE